MFAKIFCREIICIFFLCIVHQIQSLLFSSTKTLTSMVEVEQKEMNLKTRFLLKSVSAPSWNSGRQLSKTTSDVVSCAALCAILRREEPCSCNVIMFVKETDECIFGTARLPLQNEETEKLFIVERTGCLVCSFCCRVYVKTISPNFQKLEAGVLGQNTLHRPNTEIAPVAR